MAVSDEMPMPQDPRIEAEAAEWLVLQDRGFTPEQQDRFLQWLAATPAHREAFRRHSEMWKDFDLLAQWRPEHSAEPNPDLLAPPRKIGGRLYWLAPLALAAAAVLVIALQVKRPSAPPADPVSTFAFEATSYRRETLSDGSVVEMNRGAHLVVRFSAAERRVLLAEGEAEFSVAKNVGRPFIVRAGGVDVRAVGTAFNVKLAGANVEVLVTEGVVQLAQSAASSSSSDVSKGAEPPVVAKVSAGQHVVVPLERGSPPPTVTEATPADIRRLLAWQPSLLDFDSAPLATVVGEFNRRNRIQLVIADEALRDLPIVAFIHSDNVDGFVRLLEATFNVRAERSGETIRLYRK